MRPSTRPVDGPQPEIWLESRQLRTLAHPLRARLLGALRLDGPATATELARALDTNTGATSYHLRQLAEVGLVVEEPDRGSGRQRYWRAAQAAHGWWDTDHSDPDDRAALDWLAADQINAMAEEAAGWRAVRTDRPREWQDAAAFSDLLLHLRPEELRALNDELHRVVERYHRETTPRREGTEQVFVFFAAFPRGRAGRTAAASRDGAATGPRDGAATGPRDGAATGPRDGAATGPRDGRAAPERSRRPTAPGRDSTREAR